MKDQPFQSFHPSRAMDEMDEMVGPRLGGVWKSFKMDEMDEMVAPACRMTFDPARTLSALPCALLITQLGSCTCPAWMLAKLLTSKRHTMPSYTLIAESDALESQGISATCACEPRFLEVFLHTGECDVPNCRYAHSVEELRVQWPSCMQGTGFSFNSIWKLPHHLRSSEAVVDAS